jgi:hypothetical protein
MPLTNDIDFAVYHLGAVDVKALASLVCMALGQHMDLATYPTSGKFLRAQSTKLHWKRCLVASEKDRGYGKNVWDWIIRTGRPPSLLVFVSLLDKQINQQKWPRFRE